MPPLRDFEHPPDPLPLFNTACDPKAPAAAPPFEFPDVTMRIFPLPANYEALRRFCDQVLNLAPEFALFRPSMPFVMLTIVHYGRMSVEQGNLGWTSQNEVLFSVPLEWYVPRDGRWVFHGLAQMAPFIFVDNEASQVVGREVYGWPKVQGWFAGEIDRWAVDPRSRRQLLRLDTRLFKRLYQGRRPLPRTLLTIEEDPHPSFTLFPPQPDGPLNPLAGVSKALTDWAALFTRGFEALTRLQQGGPLERRTLPDLAAGVLGSLDRIAGTMHANTINLKQFRDATQPQLACYQALTNASAEVVQVQRGGMLGDAALAAGDPSGGHVVCIHRYAAQPIVDTLGLTLSDEKQVDGGSVAMVKPVLPYWMKLDFRYLTGGNICWRTDRLPWRNDKCEIVPTATSPVPALPAHYNTIGSMGFEVAAGPFRFPRATARVLPLLADRAQLQKLVDGYLNFDPETGQPNDVDRFEVWGRYVYLVLQGFDAMSSESDNVGLWADKLAQFAIPVRWYQRYEGGERLASVGLFSPYFYSNNDIQTTTLREVSGWEAIEASIEPATDPWIDQEGPFAKARALMNVDTQVFPVLGEGQESRWCTLFEVIQGDLDVWQERGEWSQRVAGPKQALEDDVERMKQRTASPYWKALRALAAEPLGNAMPINHFSLKQFRDTGEPLRACYQSLVRSETVLERVHDIEEIPENLTVAIHRYPTEPIVDKLGLVIQSRYATPDSAVDCVQVSRPFFVRADLRTELGEILACRICSTRWQRTHDEAPAGYFLGAGPTAVGEGLVDAIDSRPQGIAETLRVWSRRMRERLDRDTAARAVTADLEPQMVIHAMLSCGWDRAGERHGPLGLFLTGDEEGGER